LTSTLAKPDGFGRVLRSSSGSITGIIEESEADESMLAITEVNCGVYCFRATWLWENLASLPPSPRGEIFLTDLIARAVQQGLPVESVLSHDADETIGINNRVQLAEAEAVLRQRIRARWMLNGVTMSDPASVYIGASAELGEDTTVLPNTHIIGRSRIGANCEIGPNSIIEDSTIGNSCKIIASFIEGSTLGEGVDVGPFSHIRPGTHLESDVHIGNFAEVKNSHLGPGTKSGHFSYIGDAKLGANVNIGAGTVTCNFDGDGKNQTTIGDDAFIGSDTMLVAPVEIGARASTGAGSVVTRDVPPDMVAIGMPARTLPKKKKAEKD
jgi:bifunctional UDP-N-acetylglucosamine pyrophosphorylase/glucosamine-1-phosphate N-acetyltransferase